VPRPPNRGKLLQCDPLPPGFFFFTDACEEEACILVGAAVTVRIAAGTVLPAAQSSANSRQRKLERGV
jgi:hypothetical protein